MDGVRTVGRYELYGAIATGGMAAVHFGRLAGAVGFRRVVAIKRLHPAYASDPRFRAMLTDEARLVASVRHANVASILDVIEENEELSLVLEYVSGESLARLARTSRQREAPVPPSIVAALAVGVLRGLHAAHEATDAQGTPIGLVHRDVSPQNVVVGVDGVPRVLDFGVAKALGRVQHTDHGEVKGKAGYMAPEQVRGEVVDRRADVFAAGIVTWELLVGRRLFGADSGAASMMRILEVTPEAPSAAAEGVPSVLDAIVLRALARDQTARFSTAAEMADAIEAATDVAQPAQVAAWVSELAADALRERAEVVRAIEAGELARVPEPRAAEAMEAERPPPAPAPVARRSRLPLVATLSMLSLGAIVTIAFALHARPAHQDSAAQALPSASVATANDPPANPPAPSAAAPAPQSLAIADPAPEGSTSELSTSAPKGRPTTRPPRSAAPKGRGKASAPSCSPPYTVDPAGNHRMKPECI